MLAKLVFESWPPKVFDFRNAKSPSASPRSGQTFSGQCEAKWCLPPAATIMITPRVITPVIAATPAPAIPAGLRLRGGGRQPQTGDADRADAAHRVGQHHSD